MNVYGPDVVRSRDVVTVNAEVAPGAIVPLVMVALKFSGPLGVFTATFTVTGFELASSVLVP